MDQKRGAGHGYHRDAGTPITHLYDHNGDSEFILLQIEHDGTDNRWKVYRAFLSAHYGTGNDRSRWAHWSALEYYINAPRAAPKIYVAHNKHGNYVSEAQCDNLGGAIENCHNQGDPEWVDVFQNRNIGSSTLERIDGVYSTAGYFGIEYFWTDIPFRGWQGTGGGSATPYRTVLTNFDF